jgi:transcriptional regulator with GAF, ATPase, and Fis domain
MASITAAQAFAQVSAALVNKHDIAGTLEASLRNCAQLTSTDACGLLVVADGGTKLQLLGATSHRVFELELFQTQIEEGPCLEAWRQNEAVSLSGKETILERWGRFGPSVIAAGFESVHALPVRWHDKPLGALNLFRTSPQLLTADERALAQAFADLAIVLIVQTDNISAEVAISRTRNALEGRALIEQAKGVLSHQLRLDMESAYTCLEDTAAHFQTSLTETATAIVQRAQRR